jgi:hypothetical protein
MQKHRIHKSSGISSETESDFDNSSRRGSIGNATVRSTSSWGPPRPLTEPPETAPKPYNQADVLAFTKTHHTPDLNTFSHEELSKLIKRHPRGKLFNLDADGALGSSSSSDEYSTNDSSKSTKLPATKKEALLLHNHFPAARQIIFLPLWDATSSRFSAFFAYTTNEFRNLASNPDFLYCIAFCNCVMTEISRLATLAADQQKSDFIGSVSHELRSPLHGILASCEFLGDTETTSFQKSLVDTADSCARTLLDTINMVLDYSKINAFERNASKARRQGKSLQSSLKESTGQPQLNIYADVDLAAIAEEVVEGVATGQIFKDSLTGFGALDVASDMPSQSYGPRKDVEIIIDIAPRSSARDWVFVTQPGAFRRIIMNIFVSQYKLSNM